jgi:single-strand DNA-binding protein
MIKLQIIGHLGKDASVNEVNGKKVINFSVAHTESYKDRDGVEVKKTTWVECSRWSDSVAVAGYMKKGSMIFAEGIPEIRTYEKADGTNGASFEYTTLRNSTRSSNKWTNRDDTSK